MTGSIRLSAESDHGDYGRFRSALQACSSGGTLSGLHGAGDERLPPGPPNHAAPPGNLDSQGGGHRRGGHVCQARAGSLECQLRGDASGHQKPHALHGAAASSAAPSDLSTALWRPMSSAWATSSCDAASTSAAA